MNFSPGLVNLYACKTLFLVFVLQLIQLPSLYSCNLIENSPTIVLNNAQENLSICQSSDFKSLNKLNYIDRCTYKFDKEMQIPNSPNNVQMSLKAIQNSFQVHKNCTTNEYCYSCCLNSDCQELKSCNIEYELKQNNANLYVMFYTISLFAATQLLILNHFVMHNSYEENLKEILSVETDNSISAEQMRNQESVNVSQEFRAPFFDHQSKARSAE